ncbi:MAG: fibronectin type III domain-containing protein [Candidatus Thermoplasmatota archaeon]|nr:fibronectin type III domain-containing protein [Candidatus Thermoplasmatota archaeon]
MRSIWVYLLIISMVMTMIFTGPAPVDVATSQPTRSLPTAPNNLSAVPGNKQVLLTWDDPDDFGGKRNGFNIYRNRTPEFGVEAYKNLGPFVKTYRDTDVINGMTYYYAVAAINLEEGVGELTNPFEAKPVGRPTEPLNVSTNYSSNQVFFTWEPPENDGGSPVIGYSLVKGISSSALDTRINITNVTSFTDTDVKNGVPYSYRVFAFNERLDGYKSDEIRITPKGIPSPPGNLTGTGTNRTAQLNWTYPEDDGGTSVTGYIIFRGTPGGELYNYSGIVEEEKFHDNNITCGDIYRYAVSAVNSEGVGEMTEVIEITPFGAPDGPLNLTVEPRDRAAHLTWRPTDDDGGKVVLGYYLYRTTKGSEMKLIGDVGNVLEYTDTNLTNELTYYYQVRAYNEIGIGNSSETVSIKPDELPNPPANFRLIEGNGKISLLWTKPQMMVDYPVKEYLIYRGLEEEELELFIVQPGSEPTYIDLEVEVGQIYYYQIQSISRIGTGPMSSVIFGIPFTTPADVQNLEVVGRNKKVALTWDPPQDSGGRDIIQYKIYRGPSPDEMTSIHTVNGNTTTYLDDKVDNGARYFYGIMAVNEELEGEVTGEIEIFPLGPPTVPKNTAADVVDGMVMVTWHPPLANGGRPILGYSILRGSSDLDLVEIDRVGNVHNYTDTTAEKGIEYYYSVKAYNEVNESAPSRSAIVMIFLPSNENEEGISPLLIVLALVIVILLVIGIAAAVIMSARKRKEEEGAVAVELEESEQQREKRLIRERRENASEFTDVNLTTDEAHAHDHDERKTSTYDDLYGNNEKSEGETTQQDTPEPAAPPPEVTLPQTQVTPAAPLEGVRAAPQPQATSDGTPLLAGQDTQAQ